MPLVRRYRKIWLAAVLAVGVILAGPVLVGAAGRNAAGLQALAACAEGGAGVAPDTLADYPFFAAGAARCAGDLGEAREQAARALLQPGARVEVLAAAFPEDLALAQVAVAHQPGNADAHFWLARLLAPTDAGGALEAYEAGLALAPRAANQWYLYGVLMERQLGDWEGAAAAYDQACLFMDQGKNGCPNAGRLYFEHGQFELALAAYEQSLKQLPNWPAAQEGYRASLEALNNGP